MSWEMGESGRKLCGVAIIALVVLAGGEGCWAGLVPVNSNSVIRDGIEYYIETDKVVYDLGEDVEMLYRITNWRDEIWEVGAIGSTMNIVVSAKEGEAEREVWVWHWYRGGGPGPVEFELEPGEAKEISGVWRQIDYKGTIEMDDDTVALPGTYRVEAIFKYMDNRVVVREEPVGVDIIVVPEPMAITLLALGGLLLRRRTYSK